MALDKTGLKAEILKLIDPENPGFAGFPANDAAAAANWAGVYDAYATAAADVSGDIVATKNPASLESALTLSAGTSAATAAAAFGTGFVGYWTGGTFAIGALPPSGIGGTTVFSVEATSVVLSVSGSGLETAMLAIFGELDDDVDTVAGNLADAFHDATTGDVTVRIDGLDTTPPGSGGPLPIYNEDGVS